MSVISFPVEDIRQEFLALQKIENGHFVTYFDAANGTQVAKTVVDAMATYMKNGVATADGVHGTARETARLAFRARELIAQLIRAKKDNVFFAGDTSTFVMMLSLYLSKMWDDKQVNIVLSEMNQMENSNPWRHVAEEKGVTLHHIPYDQELNILNLEKLDEIITNETRLVTIDFSSHITGVVHNIEKVIQRAKSVGAIVIVHASHVVPYFSVDFDQMDIDVLLFSADKMFGPHLGIAILADELINQLEATGTSIDELFETGTTNYEALVGIIEMVQFIASLGEGDTVEEKVVQTYSKVSMYEAYLMNAIKQGLASIPFVQIHDGGENVLHVPIIAFTIEGLDAKMVSHYLSQDHAIHADYGMFGLPHIVKHLTGNEFGVVRISIAPYNTMEEVEQFIEAVRQLEERFKK